MPYRDAGFTWSLFLDEGHCPARKPVSNGLMKISGTLGGSLSLKLPFSLLSFSNSLVSYMIVVVFDGAQHMSFFVLYFLYVCNRSIMSDIQRDSRVVSLSSRAGIRNSLVTILDQLQRCQKSLNEFLEVRTQLQFYLQRQLHMCNWLLALLAHLFMYSCLAVSGEALCLSAVLFHRR